MAYTNINDNIYFVDDDEKQYTYDYIERHNDEGKYIHEHLNNLLEKRDKLRDISLAFYKDVLIRDLSVTVYKKQLETPIIGYYTIPGGLYCIQSRDIRILKLDICRLQPELERLKLI
jgi:hypothetical protein